MTDVATPTNSNPGQQSHVAAQLSNRDYTVIIDKSGSMLTADVPGYKSRWDAVKESVQALARKLDEYDPDGITLYQFATNFRRWDNVTPSKVDQLFTENEPGGGTNLHTVLDDAFKNYFERKANGETKAGETFFVVTDGEPNDQAAVAQVIKKWTLKMTDANEIQCHVLRIGQDPNAAIFIRHLDDNLTKEGAKYDIVHAKTFDEAENTTVKEMLTNCLQPQSTGN